MLLGEEGAKSPHEYFCYHQRNDLRAVRHGNWKCFRNGQLYNLAEDLGEKKNIANAHPDVIKRLQKVMNEFEKELAEGARPVGVAKNPRTLVPRPGVKGEEGFTPTLKLGVKKK